jgi:hypothetical protein
MAERSLPFENRFDAVRALFSSVRNSQTEFERDLMAPSSFFWRSGYCLLWLRILGGPLSCNAGSRANFNSQTTTQHVSGKAVDQAVLVASRSVKPQPPAFVIGVWCQPVGSFAKWKARGLNTLVGYESQSNSVSIDQWSAAAASNEMWMIRQPRSNPKQDRDQPYLLAWQQQDEPDVHNTPASSLKDLYGRLHSAQAERAVFLNVSGGNVLFNRTPRAIYQEYFAAADWIANDLYPVTGWDQPTWLSKVGQAVDECRSLSRGKPQFAFIETSQQRLSWTPKKTPGVTPAQLRVEIWDAVIHGVSGIIYFPDQFNPFNYDGTPTAVAAEMGTDDALLAQVAPMLATTDNAPNMTATVNAPLEVAWRTSANGAAYLFVLNLSPVHQSGASVRLAGFPVGTAHVINHANATVNVTGNGLTDNFAGYDLHIYVIPPASAAPARR